MTDPKDADSGDGRGNASARHKPPVTTGFRLFVWVAIFVGAAMIALIGLLTLG